MEDEEIEYEKIEEELQKQGFKKCPQCGRHVFKTTTKCPKCGHEFISTNCSFTMIEKQAALLFELAGWKVAISGNRHDLELLFNGKPAGFVEIFKNASKSSIVNKIMLFRKNFLQENPKIAVLTDLYTFFVSYNGEPFREIKHAPTPYEGEFFVDFIKECLEGMPVKNGDENDDNK